MKSYKANTFLNEEFKERQMHTKELEEEYNMKQKELTDSKKKLEELKQWLDSLLKLNETKLDMVPQIKAGLSEIEVLRDENYNLRKQFYIEKRNTDLLMQRYFKMKKRVIEQKISLNDVDKGIIILENDGLANKINTLSAELDILSRANVRYTEIKKEDDTRFFKRYQSSMRVLINLKNEYMKLIGKLIKSENSLYKFPNIPEEKHRLVYQLT